MSKQVFIPQHPPLTKIELISVRIHAPSVWTHKKGIRIFFEHKEETILDQFAYRLHRPIDEYTRLIRGPIANEIKRHERAFNIWGIKIRCVPNQQPYMGSYNEQWFPRDAFIIVKTKTIVSEPYNHPVDCEVLATVRNL